MNESELFQKIAEILQEKTGVALSTQEVQELLLEAQRENIKVLVVQIFQELIQLARTQSTPVPEPVMVEPVHQEQG